MADYQPALLTVTEAARVLRVGKSTIYKLLGRRELRAIKIGVATRITRESVDQILGAASSRGA